MIASVTETMKAAMTRDLKKRLFGKMISQTTVYSASFGDDLIQQQQLGCLVGYSPMLYNP
jgi:hypothetical protein